MLDSDYLLNYQFGSYEWARDMLRGGYITKEAFTDFIEYNNLHFCEAFYE